MNGEIVIRPQRNMFRVGLRELWDYRELALFFVWRDIKIRYKQTAIGILWALFQPVAAMLIFTVFFGKLARMSSDNIPYPVFVYTGLLLWNYFSSSLLHSSESMVANANIIQKTYFPRLIIPLASSLTGLIDLAIASLVLAALMFFYHFSPGVKIIFYLPALILISFLSSTGLGCFFTSVNVKYRDVRYVMPFFIQTLMFLTPVIYPISIAGDKYRWLFLINPMSGVIETTRAVIFNTRAPDPRMLYSSFAVSAVLFVTGIAYFRKTEKYFADII
ncbi:MAG: ABC transporter permease [Candidatus Omnitrophica bacterium]|nr:ABC transporter permease [Candidatus Omnitrophota bacterium]